MGDRFYRQIGKANNLTSVAEIMDFCHRPIVSRDKRTKSDIAVAIGIPGVDKLTKDNMLWLEQNIHDLKSDIVGKLKKDYVSKLSLMFPELDWNKLTLVTIKDIIHGK
jgi:hypothetical protein